MSAYRRGRTVPSAGAGRRSSLAEVVEAHRGPHLVERPAGLRPGTLAPRGDDLLDELRVALVARAPLADGCEEALQGLVQALLDLDVADLPGAVASLEVLDLRGVVVEGVVIDEDGVALDPPGIRGADAAGVGVHALDLQPHGLRLVGEVDGVVEALAHLRAPVGAGEETLVRYERVGHREDRGEQIVEAARDLAGQLDVRLLVA